MKLLLVSATEFEILPIFNYLDQHFKLESKGCYIKEDLKVCILITGVGMIETSYHLTNSLNGDQYDLVVNLGIAGAFDKEISLGSVFNIDSDYFGDLGVEEKDGTFTDLFELGLLDTNHFPFSSKRIRNELQEFSFLPNASAVSVNKVHGNQKTIKAFKAKNDAMLETMEGAAFFYVCKMKDQQCLQIRSVSNHVTERIKGDWKIDLAIENLGKVIVALLETFMK